jgi:hypothetical protein
VSQSFQQEDDDVPQRRYHISGRTLPDPAGVLTERPIAHAVEAVFDPQWLRTSPSNSFAPARSFGKLVIPITTLVSTFSPVIRSRVRRKTCEQPGQSDPRYSANDDVTSIDRLSIRPCPLSTSQDRSISSSRRAAWRGEKAGLGLGEGGRDVLPSVG